MANKSEPATSGGNPIETEVGSVFVSNYPPYSAWETGQIADAAQVFDQPPHPETPLGLYMHIPFCRKRCKFCYFKVYTEKNSAEVGRYLDGLAAEVAALAARRVIGARPLKFIYFGGGTPSFISAKHLRQLVDRVRQVTDWSALEEMTFECEPGTLTEKKLETIREIGVTRLSLGVENFDDRILEENGRAHLSREIHRVIPWIRSLDFDQLNIDLIAGMIGESWESWKLNVKRALELAPDSLTVYQMELPFNTVYSRKLLDGEGGVAVADWETKRAWHDYAFAEFEAAGYKLSSGYTVVKGDRPVRFVYRDSVWKGCDLLGTGVASFGHVKGVHYQNESGWEPYLSRVEAGESPLSRAYATRGDERLIREFILQMKLGRLDREYFSGKFNVDVAQKFAAPLEKLERDGMLKMDASGIQLTRTGLLRVDTLLPEFYDPVHHGARYT